MKKIIGLLALFSFPFLFIGVYQTRWIEDDQTVFFVKRKPTYKIRFINVFRSDHEDNWNGYLDEKERQYTIDFCKYYVGIDTAMNTMDDFYKCKEAYESAIKNNPPS
jgi:hypothetical protein